jgi:hypothetical protein
LGQQKPDPTTARLAPVETPRLKTQAKFLQIANLQQLQHYKDRNPPWIKLHAHWLEHYEFQQLPDATKGHFFLIMILASRCGNKIPNDPGWVAARIGANEPVNLSALLGIGVLEPLSPGGPRSRQKSANKGQLSLPDASTLLAERYQDASKVLAQSRAKAEPEAEAAAEAASGGAAAASGSRFSLSECLLFAEHLATARHGTRGAIENPGGLGRRFHETGSADEEIEQFLRPSQPLPAQPRREFLDQPCTACAGTLMEARPGKGARQCTRCRDELGQRTGREPKPERE